MKMIIVCVLLSAVSTALIPFGDFSEFSKSILLLLNGVNFFLSGYNFRARKEINDLRRQLYG